MFNKILIRRSPGVFEDFSTDDYLSLFKRGLAIPEFASQSVDMLLFVEQGGDFVVNGDEIKCHRVHFNEEGRIDNRKHTERLHLISEILIARGYGVARKSEPSLEEVELRQTLKQRHSFNLSRKDHMVLEAS